MHQHDDPHDPNPEEPAAPETWRRLRLALTPAQREFWNHAVRERDEKKMAGAAWNGLRFLDPEILAELSEEIRLAWPIAEPKEAAALRAVQTAIFRIENQRLDLAKQLNARKPPAVEQAALPL